MITISDRGAEKVHEFLAAQEADASLAGLGVRGDGCSGFQYQLALERRVQWGEPHPRDEELMLELRRSFKGEVAALSEYLDRDLIRIWGYDGIG